MPHPSPIRRAFDAIARRPALLLAEVTWRWCFAVAAWTIAIVALLEYLNSIPVSWREQLLVESGQPLLLLAALAHALRGSAVRLAASVIVAGTAIVLFWIFVAALGRLLTLKALLPRAALSYSPLLGLSFLRAALFLAVFLAAAGALLLAGFVGPRGNALVLPAVLLTSIWLVWALLNWLLSLAAIFAVRDGEDTFSSIAEAVNLIRSALGDVVLASLPFVLLHYLALAASLAAGVLVFDWMTRVTPVAGWALPAIAVAYFAYADFLYITRLAAYVSLAVPGSEPTVIPEPIPSPSPEVPSPADGPLPATSY